MYDEELENPPAPVAEKSARKWNEIVVASVEEEEAEARKWKKRAPSLQQCKYLRTLTGAHPSSASGIKKEPYRFKP
jgi:hypothetical protein